ncbi:MAG: GNAT family N-acetyltransferase [Balneolales bacterium]|nr:GNAT family N-acetyltransferase [Balneolales bacterium]
MQYISDPHTDIRLVRFEAGEIDRFASLNYELFKEKRIINRTNHNFLVSLACIKGDIVIGFKIGYGKEKSTFYSAKGGVLPEFRNKGLAKAMMHEMMSIARKDGFELFEYDTFPNMHAGMLILGLKLGFTVKFAGYNARYSDYQITLQKHL